MMVGCPRKHMPYTSIFLLCVAVTTFQLTSQAEASGSALRIRTLHGHGSSIMCLSFAPDGKTLASASRDNTVRFWDVSTGKCVRALKHHTDQVFGVCYSPDGNLLATASADKRVCL